MYSLKSSTFTKSKDKTVNSLESFRKLTSPRWRLSSVPNSSLRGDALRRKRRRNDDAIDVEDENNDDIDHAAASPIVRSRKTRRVETTYVEKM